MTATSFLRNDLRSFGYSSASNSAKVSGIRLNANENPWNAGRAGENELNRYPEKQPHALVQRLSELYSVSPESLLVVRGADDGIDLLIRAACAPTCDQIIQCPPTFPMYSYFAGLHAVSVCEVPLEAENNMRLDVHGILTACSDRTRIVFLCSPNNPTGGSQQREVILELAQSLQERVLIVVDEAYIEFSKQPSVAGEVARLPNLVVLRTLSKAYSLAGLRIGSVIGDRDLIASLRRIFVPYPLSRPAVDRALEFTSPQHRQVAAQRIAEILSRRDSIVQRLQRYSGVERIYPSDSNFVLVQVHDAGQLVRFCTERGVLLRGQSDQALVNNCVRISVGSDEEMRQLFGILDTFFSAAS